jgi:DNA-directed RNA polymerase specialized sigma24 family protein
VEETDTLCKRCGAERKDFKSSVSKSSPACAELFRRAFQKEKGVLLDQAAWTCLEHHFRLQLSNGIRRFYETSDLQDIEDAVQEGWFAFVEAAPSGLVSGDKINAIVSYLQECVINAYRMERRSQKAGKRGGRSVMTFADLIAKTGLFLEDELLPEEILPGEDPGPDIDSQLIFKKLIEILDDAATKLAVICRFLYRLSSIDISTMFPDFFPAPQDVDNQLRKAMRQYRRGRNEDDSAFLQIEMNHDGDVDAMENDRPCRFNEAILLDYVNGIAPVEIRMAIERSPECVKAAAELQKLVTSWIPTLRQLACPDAEALVNYAHRRVTGPNHLKVWRHVSLCLHCQNDLKLISAMDEALSSENWLGRTLRKVIEAVELSATMVRGELAPARGGKVYSTQPPSIDIVLTPNNNSSADTELLWSVSGDLRTQDGRLVRDYENVIFVRIDDPDENEHVAEQLEDGLFWIKNLEAGDYRVHVLLADQEIFIKNVPVGERI